MKSACKIILVVQISMTSLLKLESSSVSQGQGHMNIKEKVR